VLYENMARRLESPQIPASALHLDGGVRELNPRPIFGWRAIYRHLPKVAHDDG